jgi:hypothetical protein
VEGAKAMPVRLIRKVSAMKIESSPDVCLGLERISRLARSQRPSARLKACDAIAVVGRRLSSKNSCQDRAAKRKCFDLAAAILTTLMKDPIGDVRNRAVCSLNPFLKTFPDDVWSIIEKYSNSPDREMRAAIACCLLEHIFEEDFRKYFGKVKKIIHKGGTKGRRMLDTLDTCWYFDNETEAKALAYSRSMGRRRYGTYG